MAADNGYMKLSKAKLITFKRGVTFHSLFDETHSFLVARCKRSLVTLLQTSLVTRCRSCLLQKITRYSLQTSLVTRFRSCSLQKITRYSLQNSLVTRCKNSLVTRCKLCLLLAATSHLLLNTKNHSSHVKTITSP